MSNSETSGEEKAAHSFSLHMPDAEKKVVTGAYQKAKVILEYGSGGSTMLAARPDGPKVFSIESDPDWAKELQKAIDRTCPEAAIDLRWIDIGPVKTWGKPVNARGWRQYHRYPLAIWDDPNFEQPDLALIDGRFRAGCFLACLFRTQAPMTVLWDDYRDRENYHRVEEFVKPVEMIGRMARFEISPTAIPPARLTEIVRMMILPA